MLLGFPTTHNITCVLLLWNPCPNGQPPYAYMLYIFQAPAIIPRNNGLKTFRTHHRGKQFATRFSKSKETYGRVSRTSFTAFTRFSPIRSRSGCLRVPFFEDPEAESTHLLVGIGDRHLSNLTDKRATHFCDVTQKTIRFRRIDYLIFDETANKTKT